MPPQATPLNPNPVGTAISVAIMALLAPRSMAEAAGAQPHRSEG